MKYEIQGEPMPVVICDLESGEPMITEKGSMVWMSPNMEMETSAGGLGKAFGRMFSGESIFQNIYTPRGGPGMIAFASTFPGSIRGMKEWRHRIHGPVVTTPIKYEDSIDQETEAGACMSVYWPNTIYAAFTAVRDTLKKFAETRDMTKVDAKFDEDELLKLLPLVFVLEWGLVPWVMDGAGTFWGDPARLLGLPGGEWMITALCAALALLLCGLVCRRQRRRDLL